MKYVKSFESHRNSKKLEPINEELLGGIMNFFKGLWAKAMEELKKLGEDPDTGEVKDWIAVSPAANQYAAIYAVFNLLTAIIGKAVRVSLGNPNSSNIANSYGRSV